MISIGYYRSVKITIKNKISHYRVAKMWSFILRYSTVTDKLQNYRTLEVGRDLWRSSSSTCLLREWSRRASCPGPWPVRFWISPRMEMPQLVRTTCSTVRSSSTWESCFFCWNFLVQFVPIASCPVSWDRWEALPASPSVVDAPDP